jgi:3-phosphoshikimate 1-carboxyvinyltransferase
MRLKARASGALRGRVRPPGDKSISHRALILGAMAEGVTEIEGLLEADDVLRTAGAVKAFGAEAEQHGAGRWSVTGTGGFKQPAGLIDCGNSGTGVRLLIGAAAGYSISARFDGDSSLRKRPMGRVMTPLTRMGARFDAAKSGHLPLTLHGGNLTGVEFRSPVASAQVKSAVLLAGLNAEGDTVLTEPAPSRDHTERMLKAFGADIEPVKAEDGAPGARVRRSKLSAAPVSVPADPSSAAFAIAAGLLVPNSEVVVEGVLVNPLRAGLFETLIEMGAKLREESRQEIAGEPISDLKAQTSALKGVSPPVERAPSMIDEYPILAICAAFAEGETRLTGAEELRVKESDRIALTAAGLKACGVEVEELPDGLVIQGRGPKGVKGGASIKTGGDHRIAMSFLILGLASKEPVVVDEADMIATSFPGFAALMRSLGASIEEV